jgi:hypothetical protein
MENVKQLTRPESTWPKVLGADAVLERRGYPIIIYQTGIKMIGTDNPAKHQRELAERLLAANANRLAATAYTHSGHVCWLAPAMANADP